MKQTLAKLSAIALILFFRSQAQAATGGSGLPWETPLQTIVDSFTGPVAFTISILGIVIFSAILIWGGEIDAFARKLITLVLAISVLAFAAPFLAAVFGVNGAVI